MASINGFRICRYSGINLPGPCVNHATGHVPEAYLLRILPTEIYIEALLADEELADQVYEDGITRGRR